MGIIELLKSEAGVSAFSTLAGFNVCAYAGAEPSEADFQRLERLAGVDRRQMKFPVQTHSARVVRVDSSTAPDALQGVDGVVTSERGLLVGVHTADCLPLLLADARAGVVGAIHCGWRGIVGGIVGRAVEAMSAAGAREVVAACGPCICAGCFEVGPEVSGLFDPRAVIESPGSRPHVDLAAAVGLQLRAAGIDRFELPPRCSRCSSDLYSVRRQGRELPYRTLTAIKL